jgi:two-component system CheB/CheR fusion protein
MSENDATAHPSGPARATPRSASNDSFPLIAVGASAGGLEAFRSFVQALPHPCPAAVVILQHLDPQHVGHLAELLQQSTTIPVRRITDGALIEPGLIHVLPSGYALGVTDGHFQLLELSGPRGRQWVIDAFFRSLADTWGTRAVGVVLSGMGTDGTLGLQAIKEHGGTTFAQLPESATFDAMPYSAVRAGVVDVVAKPEDLPARILRSVAHPDGGGAWRRGAEHSAQAAASEALERILKLLRVQTGRDFSQYKPSTILRRIERRMGLHQITVADDYVRLLVATPHELDLLAHEMLIGVTSYFRDPAVWDHLAASVLPSMLLDAKPGAALRAWVPACSTGEEAYTLAMLFLEAVEHTDGDAPITLQIFATDLDPRAIEQARTGLYPASIVRDVSMSRLNRFFLEEHGSYRVRQAVRELVVFATQDIILDPPFIRLDLISCRNLLIYLDAALQQRLLEVFHYSLRPHGVLLLGIAETVGGATDLFATVDSRFRIFRRLDRVDTTERLTLPPMPTRSPAASFTPVSLPPLVSREVSPNLASIQSLADQAILSSFAPAAVLTTVQGDIVYISGRTGPFLEPATGKANLNLFAMARAGLRDPLYEAFQRAVRQSTTVHARRLCIEGNGMTQQVHATVQPLTSPPALRGLMIVVFEDASADAMAGPPVVDAAVEAPEAQRIASLTQALHASEAAIHTLRDQMQSSEEALRLANEELQSTIEELQSTNEELTTSKEEMQSMNEELQTVNQELMARVDELSRASSDLDNLLNSTNVATLFLDGDLQVRRFTPAMTRIVKLIPSDIGRPITDLVLSLDYPSLADDVRSVLRTLLARETQVHATDARWYMVRIMPYQTKDRRIDGVVITCIDVTPETHLEALLHATIGELRAMPHDPEQEPRERLAQLENTLVRALATLHRTVPQSRALP